MADRSASMMELKALNVPSGHYDVAVLGGGDHLEEQQLRKLGLRFYLPAGDNSDITKRVEFCTPAHLDAFTHQIDRGRFENELFRRARKAGADPFRGCG